MEKPLLILDLDGTLIDTTINVKHDLDDEPDLIYYENNNVYRIWKRPYLDDFLEWAFDYFYVAIWSAASEDYVRMIIDELKPDGREFEFIWSSERCNYRYQLWGGNDEIGLGLRYDVIKNLKKVWRLKENKCNKYSKYRTLIVDDTPSTYLKNYGNAIPIESYNLTFKNDEELLRIKQLLMYLLPLNNFRIIEKRPDQDRYPI